MTSIKKKARTIYLIIAISFIIGVLSCSTKQKTLQEEYNEDWIEFWDNPDLSGSNLNLIQTINEKQLPLYDYHFKKESSDFKGKFLIALKNTDLDYWDYYIVWSDIHKIEGPFKNDADIIAPNTDTKSKKKNK